MAKVINGEEIEFDAKTQFSDYRLKQLWREICDSNGLEKPFPNIEAYLLDKNEYDAVHKILVNYKRRRFKNFMKRKRIADKLEYGHIIPKKRMNESLGCVQFNERDKSFLIFVKQQTEYEIDYILKHELSHAYFMPIEHWKNRFCLDKS